MSRIHVTEIILLAEVLDDQERPVGQIHRALRSADPALPGIVGELMKRAERFLFYNAERPHTRSGEAQKP